MKVIVNNQLININFVNDKSDKYLVIVDDVNKVKYSANTMSEVFNDMQVDNLILSFAKNVQGQEVDSFETIGKVRRVCHNDDFYQHYKKNYKFISHNVTKLWY